MQFKYCFLVSALLAGYVANGDAQEDVSFPYQALVLNDQAPVVSGPGSTHYATENLPINSTVSVYRHDPGGWCAIQPPEGSFSLIPESAVEIVEKGIGRVVGNGTQAWVGTRLGAVDKPLWQIKLDKDELVDVLGSVSWPNPEGHSTIWYQIGPPAGEFRWIKKSDLQLPPHMKQTPTIIDPGVVPAAGIEDVPLRQTSQAANAGWRPASRPIPATAHSPAESNSNFENSQRPNGFSTPVLPDSTSRSTSQPNRQQPTRYADSRMSSANWSGGISTSYGPTTDRLQKIELQLTEQMLRSPDQWQLEDLKINLDSIISQSNSASEREHGNRLRVKIENCQRIRSGFRRAYDLKSTSTSSNRAIGSGLDNDVELGATYDAHGYLNELIRDRGTLNSTYVLQDENGKITHHISGVPGLNLHRYLKQKVGIIGQRGYHQKLNMDHVTAERVVVLNRFR